MKKIDIVSIAFGNFKRRKTRSVLTVLGVVIGVASIVIMISLGIAVKESFNKSIKDMSDLTTISVNPGFDQKTGKQSGTLNDELVSELEQIENVTAVSPEVRLNGKLVAGKYFGSGNIVGINSKYIDKLGFKIDKGTLEGLGNAGGKTIHCIFGSEVAYSFYDPKKRDSRDGMMMGGMGGMDEQNERPPALIDPMDDKTKLRFTFDWSYGEKQQGGDSTQPVKKPVFYNMKSLGILKQGMSEKDSTVYIDMETAKKLKKEEQKAQQGVEGSPVAKKTTKFSYDQVRVFTKSLDHTIKVTNEIKKMGYEAWSSAEWITEYRKTTDMIQLVLLGIGSVSLLVAAIGITNTMIMSIYERTREIGIMKVIGCRLKDIKSMFLYEAAFIGLFGGAVGLVLSYGGSMLLNMFGGKGGGMMGGDGTSKLSVIPPWLAILAVLFAILVALVSGFLPARRAMQLSALEAMKT